MKMQLGRWGNSLAVRIPKDVVDRLRLEEGVEIEADALEAALADAMKKRRLAAVERIKARAIPLPPDYKFNREEANAR